MRLLVSLRVTAPAVGLTALTSVLMASTLGHAEEPGPLPVVVGSPLAPVLATVPAASVTTAQPTPTGTATTAPVSPASFASSATTAGIPDLVLGAYRTAAAKVDAERPDCHLSWTVLAGIGLLESHHAAAGGSGRAGWSGTADPAILGPVLDGTSGAAVRDSDGGALDGDLVWDRAVGPMQFLPSTWRTYGADGDGDGKADPQSIGDSTLAAARYLCRAGGDLADPQALTSAVYAYNHATWYVEGVLAASAAYATTGGAGAVIAAPAAPSAAPRPPASVDVPGPAGRAIEFAYSKLGTPYLWGGTGPSYDCSGLTQAAYAAAGVLLPRTAAQQWDALPHVSGGPAPGDLVFFQGISKEPGVPGHVGLYLGDGYMVDAPHTGAVVRVETVAGFGHYLGAARPVALLGWQSGTPGTGAATPGATPAPGPTPGGTATLPPADGGDGTWPTPAVPTPALPTPSLPPTSVPTPPVAPPTGETPVEQPLPVLTPTPSTPPVVTPADPSSTTSAGTGGTSSAADETGGTTGPTEPAAATSTPSTTQTNESSTTAPTSTSASVSPTTTAPATSSSSSSSSSTSDAPQAGATTSQAWTLSLGGDTVTLVAAPSAPDSVPAQPVVVSGTPEVPGVLVVLPSDALPALGTGDPTGTVLALATPDGTREYVVSSGPAPASPAADQLVIEQRAADGTVTRLLAVATS